VSDTKLKAQPGYDCQECGKWGPYGEVHTWLFCELHKIGWSRDTIIANVLFTADALRGVERELT
jgi:hypothetical protein